MAARGVLPEAEANERDQKPMSLIESFTSQVLAKGMDGHAARQTAIASNLANSETPGYHRRDVAFGEALSQAVAQHRQVLPNSGDELGATSSSRRSSSNPLLEPGTMRATNPLHFGFIDNDQSGNDVANVAVEATEDRGHEFKVDENGVDVESEMVRLAQNSSRFKALTVLQGRWNQQIKGVINSNG
jgi:flagellar basal-body rod protein FlgB